MFIPVRIIPRTVAAFMAGVALTVVSMASVATLASPAPERPQVAAPFLEVELTTAYGGTVQLSRETAWSPAVLACEPPRGESAIMLGEHDLAHFSTMVAELAGTP